MPNHLRSPLRQGPRTGIGHVGGQLAIASIGVPPKRRGDPAPCSSRGDVSGRIVHANWGTLFEKRIAAEQNLYFSMNLGSTPPRRTRRGEIDPVDSENDNENIN